MMGLLRAASFDTPCRIAVEQSADSFHAHVELAGDVPIGPGDRVLVHGAPIRVPFGTRAEFERTATVEIAGPLRRAWTRAVGYLDLSELYEVSFSHGRVR
jgi:hypothetical protein